ncbi:hypothetical protein LSH36_56g01004 [Paralvinella palmiformis]|uniref:PLD phosphodiesterase domain-containing protein n=1 Tax=Paralvinella palmiformis TaxID=53620 RepID=A0AAD9K538_9ANNE|nr:hypothetical protein LSH36_56g01004 [Paralvinella palmiformis]
MSGIFVSFGVWATVWIAGLTDRVNVKIVLKKETDETFSGQFPQLRLGKFYVTELDATIKYRWPSGAAEVRTLNFSQWFGSGILHTKVWIVDKKHIYLGSANMDWRSLTQVKELGVVISNCPCLAADIQKIFDVYWYLGQQPPVPLPRSWPAKWSTKYNKDTPVQVTLNGRKSEVYFSSSPSPICPDGRTPDLDALLDVINKADRYVYIAVMDYMPLIEFSKPVKFWPVIDDALRRVALEKNVEVRLLASCWRGTRPDMAKYLLSLSQLNHANNASISTKMFYVPSTPDQRKIPYARLNHNKYMVTDNRAFIGTSNWSGSYFTSTGGVSIVVHNPNDTTSAYLTPTLQQQLAAVFERDWNSSYALPVKEALDKCKMTAIESSLVQ